MDSLIKEFYKNKTIFLTGGTGFLGKVVIEKVLRATETSRIYVLIRSKRGKSPQDRIDEWKTDPFFGVLLKIQPNALERIVPISGDCEEPDLGISAADRELLKNEVQVVIHCAATVNFAEPLHKAVDINTRATQLMLNLAKEMSRLVGFVHVSTAFSNCVISHISEQYYPDNLIAGADKVLSIRNVCGDNLLDRMASTLIGKFPNTYTYTKALAEQVIQTESGELPVCIFRPGAITATNKEPMSGWIDNLYGPISMIYGCAIGVLRIIPTNKRFLQHIVPVDCCANCILACAMQTAKESSEKKRRSLPPTIYNYVPHEQNTLTNKHFIETVYKHRYTCALEQALWYPFLHTTSFLWMFKLIAFFYHTLPGYAIDLVLRLRGQKPRMIKLYQKVHKTMNALAYFGTGFWTYETINTDRLWQSLSDEDKKHFEFDMRIFDWDDYFTRALVGMRVYMAKEDPSDESIMRARKHMKRLERRHRVLQLFICICGIFIFKWLAGFYL
ncbi:fatty acyl-CoA reductase wat-like [Drosophila albomicans]|uniref:Fatty acyl-CoA reductase n=1 Tax=Drosophila albomicans TaxID=7291 RepID=A0A6P8WL70_DROAB|nr:fatty acyl-CoA reductase wat-like [Drosophila albomicans]